MRLPPRTIPAPAPPAENREHAANIGDVLVGMRTFINITIPRTNAPARMRLLTRGEVAQVTADTRKHFQGHGMPDTISSLAAAGFAEEWNMEYLTRTLAWAVRELDRDESFASLLEWQGCDDVALIALYQTYKDLQTRLDPIGFNVSLTTAELDEIEAVAKKKDEALLADFGCVKLSRFILTSAAPPST